MPAMHTLLSAKAFNTASQVAVGTTGAQRSNPHNHLMASCMLCPVTGTHCWWKQSRSSQALQHNKQERPMSLDSCLEHLINTPFLTFQHSCQVSSQNFHIWHERCCTCSIYCIPTGWNWTDFHAISSSFCHTSRFSNLKVGSWASETGPVQQTPEVWYVLALCSTDWGWNEDLYLFCRQWFSSRSKRSHN